MSSSTDDQVISTLAAVRSNPAIMIPLSGLFAAGLAFAVAGEPPAALLALPIVLIGIVVCICYPRIALAIVTVVIFSNASVNLSTSFGLPSLAKLMIPGLVLLYVIRLVAFDETPYFAKLAFVAMMLFLFMRAISALYADFPSVSSHVVDGFMRDILFVILTLGLLIRKNSIEIILTAIVSTYIVVCILGAYQTYFGEHSSSFFDFSRILDYGANRFSGPFQDANFFGTMLVLSTPLAVFKTLNSQGIIRKALWAVGSGFLIFGMLATDSRGGLLGLFCGLGVYMLTLPKRQLLLLVASGVIAGTIFLPLLDDETVERFSTIIGVVESGEAVDNSTEGRLGSWKVAISLFKEHPFLGVSAGNFVPHYQDKALELAVIFRGEGRKTHSLWLEILVELGLVGMSLFLFILGTAAWSLSRAVRLARQGGNEQLARFLTAFGAGLFGYFCAMTFMHDTLPRAMWLLIGIALESSFIVSYRQQITNRYMGSPNALPS